MELYKNIKRRREELGMTQTKLAELTGYADKTAISKIESGHIDLSQSKIITFAKALKTTPSDLMGWDDNTVQTNEQDTYYTDPETAKIAQEIFDDPELRILMDAARDLAPEDLKIAVNLIKRLKSYHDAFSS